MGSSQSNAVEPSGFDEEGGLHAHVVTSTAIGEGESEDGGARKIGVPDLVVPYLYLGDIVASRNPKTLVQLKIRRILDVSGVEEDSSAFTSAGIQYFNIPNVPDEEGAPLSAYFAAAAAYICLGVRSKEAILVHGKRGASRSAALVLAYLVKYENMSLMDAHKLLITKRAMAYPNFGFWAQLIDFEVGVRGTASVKMNKVTFKTPVVDEDGNYLRPNAYVLGFDPNATSYAVGPDSEPLVPLQDAVSAPPSLKASREEAYPPSLAAGGGVSDNEGEQERDDEVASLVPS